MAEKELIPNDTPEIAKLKACKTKEELEIANDEIFRDKAYGYYSESYKTELWNLYIKLSSELPTTKKELVNFDNNSVAILDVTKHDLEKIGLNLKSDLEPITEYSALKKMLYLIDYRMQVIKDKAIENFAEKFGGSKTEKLHGITITLKELTKVSYSDKVQDLEAEIKLLQNQLKQAKAMEIKKADREVTGETLSLTLH